MMRVEKVFCDICGEELIHITPEYGFIPLNGSGEVLAGPYDLCPRCKGNLVEAIKDAVKRA